MLYYQLRSDRTFVFSDGLDWKNLLGNRSCIGSTRKRISGRREVLVLLSFWSIRILARFVSLWGNRKLWRSVLITLVNFRFLGVTFYIRQLKFYFKFMFVFCYLVQLNQAWRFRNTLEMKSLVYGTLLTLLMGNSRMNFSASDLLLLRVSVILDCALVSLLFWWVAHNIYTRLHFRITTCFITVYACWFWFALFILST